MLLMHFLRALADLSFYGALAGLAAARNGGSGAFGGMLLICLSYALSTLGGQRRSLRLVGLLPMIGAFLLHAPSLWDCLLLLPPCAYVIWLSWQGDVSLSRDRQQRLFSAFVKILPAFLLVAVILWCGEEAVAVTLPYGMMMLAASVLLMRALRHDPQVYRGLRYQAVNLLSVLVVMGGALVLSSRSVTEGAAAFIRGLYALLLQPVIQLILQAALWVAAAVGWLFSALTAGFKGQPLPEMTFDQGLAGFEGREGVWETPGEPALWLRLALSLLFWAAVIGALILFFRWLKGKNLRSEQRSPQGEQRTDLIGTLPARERRETSPVRGVRAQYRRFLKMLRSRGVEQKQSSTSLEIHRQALGTPGAAEASGPIRDIYLRARYDGDAQPEDVKQLKALNALLQKNLKEDAP